MKYVLIGYLLTFSGSMTIEDYTFSSNEVCDAYRAKIAFIVEKTQSSVRRATFVCMPEQRFQLASN